MSRLYLNKSTGGIASLKDWKKRGAHANELVEVKDEFEPMLPSMLKCFAAGLVFFVVVAAAAIYNGGI